MACDVTPIEDPNDILVIGRITGPYGVRGWVHLQSFTSPAQNLAQYSPWYWQQNKQWSVFAPSQIRNHRGGLVALVEGYNDRDQVRQLNGILIGVARTVLPKLDVDEYYWRDLIGCRVICAGDEIGTVRQLLETGANDVLMIKPTLAPAEAQAADSTDILIPFVAAYVLMVNLDDKVIHVDWQVDW